MKIFICGGGDGVQTVMANNKLNQVIDHTKPLLYIPLAMESNMYDSCYIWIKNELKNVNIPKIEMVRSANEILERNLNQYSAIFIGGGNTFKLLYDLKTSGAFNQIQEFISNGGVVFGGSAGAIIFGKNLKSCALDDENNVNLKDISGFNILNGYSLLCHYTNRSKEDDEKSKKYLLGLSMEEKIIALPEENTIYIDDDNWEFIGTKPYYIFENGKIKEKYISPELKSDNLIFKSGTLDDFKKVYEFDFVRLANVWYDTTEYIKKSENQIEEHYNLIKNQEKTYSWIIFYDNLPVGHIVADREKGDSIELAYNLHPDYWGKGIMREAVNCVCNFLLTKYDSIFVSYCTGNEKSKKLIEKLNFKPYKIIKNAWNRNGRYVDEFKYVLMKE